MNDRGGWKADRVRFKVTQDSKQAGRFTRVPCQAGWKNKDGQWTNKWVDVMDRNAGEYRKGDVLEVTGNLNVEDREWNGQKREQWTVWADEIKFMDAAPPSANRTQPGASSRNPGRDQVGNPTVSSGMDDVPF